MWQENDDVETLVHFPTRKTIPKKILQANSTLQFIQILQETLTDIFHRYHLLRTKASTNQPDQEIWS
jgi:hypothetical protein